MNNTGSIVTLISQNSQTKAAGNSSSTNPKVSSYGRFVVFDSSASNLTSGDTNLKQDVFLKDNVTNTMINITSGGNDHSTIPSISSDGRYVAFQSTASNLVASDTNSQRDIFVYDSQTQQITNISSGMNATSDTPFISSNGAYITFLSVGDNLVSGDSNGHIDVFRYDRTNAVLENITKNANAQSKFSTLSSDGNFIAFASQATNLVSG